MGSAGLGKWDLVPAPGFHSHQGKGRDQNGAAHDQVMGLHSHLYKTGRFKCTKCYFYIIIEFINIFN